MVLAQETVVAPAEFCIAILMQRRPVVTKPWLSHLWRITGVVVNSQSNSIPRQGVQVHSGPDGENYLWEGLRIRLYKDEAESYYYNLLSDKPSLFVITLANDQGMPEPHKITASFDEASAYLETEGDVETVPMPPEVYRWVESFVITHYAPERKIKRKRRNWSEEAGSE